MPIKYLHLFEREDEFISAYTGAEYNEPWVSFTEENNKVYYNKSLWKEVLTFRIISGGTITFINSSSESTVNPIQYSKNGNPWTYTEPTGSDTDITVEAGDVLQFKGDNKRYGNMYEDFSYNVSYFSSSDVVFDVEGNIMSLFNSNNFSTITTLPEAENFDDYFGMFAGLFCECTGLRNARDLVLPLLDFTVTVQGQEWPTEAYGAYGMMFEGCTGLVSAPKLPATALTESCYAHMFSNCTSLTEAPELPATTLASSCYDSMFYSCTSLTKAPSILPAMVISNYAYVAMFRNCSSLERGPEIPVGTNADSAWEPVNYMYADCSNLSYISFPSDTFYSRLGWVEGVSSTGTFVKKSGVEWPTGTNGIPDGWDVIEV